MAIKIFIDQGHNPTNPNAGAEGNGYREQDLVYEIGVLLAELLDNDPNFEARLSRNAPDEVLGTSNATSLMTRTDAANEWGADYFLSLHANASSIPTATGVEGYVFSSDSPAAGLAAVLLRALSARTGLPDRGYFSRPSLYVLRKTAMPAVLLELGFITNPSDASLMAEDPALFAEGIYNGLNEYFGFDS